MTTREERDELRRLHEAATPGPWISLRDGNQYVETRYLPTARCVGASRINEVVRPWNPHAYVQFGFTPAEFETSRFLDIDADLIAAARNALPDLLDAADERDRMVAREWSITVALQERDRLRDVSAAAQALLRACVSHGEVQQHVNNSDVIALRDALAQTERPR